MLVIKNLKIEWTNLTMNTIIRRMNCSSSRNNTWAPRYHPNNCVEEVKQPGQIKCHKSLEIPSTNACAHPWTMMVISLDAHVAFWTVHSSRGLVDAGSWKRRRCKVKDQRLCANYVQYWALRRRLNYCTAISKFPISITHLQRSQNLHPLPAVILAVGSPAYECLPPPRSSPPALTTPGSMHETTNSDATATV